MKTVAILFALSLSTSAFAAGPAAAPANPHAGAQTTLPQTGKVLSSIEVPTYTYMEVSQGNKTIWLAVNTTPVKKGDTVRFDDGMKMTNFYSKSLKRTFPSILFVSRLVVDNSKK